jgi:predicted double-glycine peptidase
MRVVFLALGFSAGIAAAPFADGARDKIENIVAPNFPLLKNGALLVLG